MRERFVKNGNAHEAVAYMNFNLDDGWEDRGRMDMEGHVFQWLQHHGHDPKRPRKGTKLDRVLDFFNPSRRLRRADKEIRKTADRLFIHALAVRAHAVAGVLHTVAKY